MSVDAYVKEEQAKKAGKRGFEESFERLRSKRSKLWNNENELRTQLIVKYFKEKPSWGGYSDVLDHPHGPGFVSEYVQRKVRRGAEESWDLFTEAGDLARKRLGLDPFDTAPTPAERHQTLAEDRQNAIAEKIRQSNKFQGFD